VRLLEESGRPLQAIAEPAPLAWTGS
jgi:hypothetical protein